MSGYSLVDQMRLLPWKEIKRAVRWYRGTFPVAWPEHRPHYYETADPDGFERRLRNDGWEGTKYSVKYEGTVVELRKPAGTLRGRAREYHLRARYSRADDSILKINCHEEYSRFEEKTLHLIEGVDWMDADEIEELVGP